jgi:hypothetical protein
MVMDGASELAIIFFVVVCPLKFVEKKEYFIPYIFILGEGADVPPVAEIDESSEIDSNGEERRVH